MSISWCVPLHTLESLQHQHTDQLAKLDQHAGGKGPANTNHSQRTSVPVSAWKQLGDISTGHCLPRALLHCPAASFLLQASTEEQQMTGQD